MESTPADRRQKAIKLGQEAGGHLFSHQNSYLCRRSHRSGFVSTRNTVMQTRTDRSEAGEPDDSKLLFSLNDDIWMVLHCFLKDMSFSPSSYTWGRVECSTHVYHRPDLISFTLVSHQIQQKGESSANSQQDWQHSMVTESWKIIFFMSADCHTHLAYLLGA